MNGRSLGLIAVTLLGSCRNLDVASLSFPTYDDAVKAGAISDHTWLPVGIPTDARDIEAAIDVDRNTVIFRFGADGISAPVKCSPVSRVDVRMPDSDRFDFAKQAWISEVRNSSSGSWFKCDAPQFNYWLLVSSDRAEAIGWTWGDEM